METYCYKCVYGEEITPSMESTENCIAPATVGGTLCTISPFSYSCISFDENGKFTCSLYKEYTVREE